MNIHKKSLSNKSGQAQVRLRSGFARFCPVLPGFLFGGRRGGEALKHQFPKKRQKTRYNPPPVGGGYGCETRGWTMEVVA
jgi:hypothetical protein